MVRDEVTITIPNVPDQAIEILLSDLRHHGAVINRPHVGYGEIESEAWSMRFWHSIGKVLTVEVAESMNMMGYPKFMVEGWIKQRVEEAVEAAREV